MYFNDIIDEYTKTLATSVISASTTVTNAHLNNSGMYTWPITIKGGISSSRVVITFGDNITLNTNSTYFIIGSDYVTIDGGNKMVTINGVNRYPGLIKNGGPPWVAGYSNITVQNININITNGSTLSDDYGNGSGWVCQYYFSMSSSGSTLITNCVNSANITTRNAGGIVGSNFAINASGTHIISNCTNNGEVLGSGAGGIVGNNFDLYGHGSTINNCINTGNINAQGAGGIAGYGFAMSSTGINTITNCANSGNILEVEAGGIVGYYTGYSFLYNTTINILNCYSTGTCIDGGGGICGKPYNSGTATIVNISNCYAKYGNIISSTTANNITFNISNTYQINGTWLSYTALLSGKLLTQVNNTYIWAYPKVNGVDQLNSPFLLYSLNPNNTPVVGYIPLTTTTVINFTVPSPKTYGDASFTIQDLSSNSPADFSYNSSNPAVATMNGRTITIVGAGNTNIIVKQDACGNYTDGSNSLPLVVNPARPTISFTVPSPKTYGDASFTLQTPSSNSNADFSYNSSNPAVATINAGIITIVGAGATTISVSQAANSNYTAGYIDASLVVNKTTPQLSNFTIPSTINEHT